MRKWSHHMLLVQFDFEVSDFMYNKGAEKME